MWRGSSPRPVAFQKGRPTKKKQKGGGRGSLRAELARFETEMWHPNIYPDGRVCISILHPPGTDRFNDQAGRGVRGARGPESRAGESRAGNGAAFSGTLRRLGGGAHLDHVRFEKTPEKRQVPRVQPFSFRVALPEGRMVSIGL